MSARAGAESSTLLHLEPAVQTPLTRGDDERLRPLGEALAVVGARTRRALPGRANGVLDVERFRIAWGEARRLCAAQTSLLEVAAETVAEAGIERAQHAKARVAVVASHAPTLDRLEGRPDELRVRCQSASLLIARGLGLTATAALDVAPSAGIGAALAVARMLLSSGECDRVLLALSAQELAAESGSGSVACFVLRSEASARRANERIRLVLPATPREQGPQRLRELIEALRLDEPAAMPEGLLAEPLRPSSRPPVHPLIAACSACASGLERQRLVLEDLLDRLRISMAQSHELELRGDTPMEELELDSLAVVELKQRLEQELSTRVSLQALLASHCIDDVASALREAIETSHGLGSIEPASTDAVVALGTASAEDLLGRLDQLSEHELDLLLKGD